MTTRQLAWVVPETVVLEVETIDSFSGVLMVKETADNMGVGVGEMFLVELAGCVGWWSGTRVGTEEGEMPF